MKYDTIHLMLDENDFECLVSGGILTVQGRVNIQIALQDIGFSRMNDLIANIAISKDFNKPRVKENDHK